MNTVCIFSHDFPTLSTAQRSVQSTDMIDDHKVVNRSRSVIPRSLAIQHVYNMYTCMVQRSAVLADTGIRLIVKTHPASVRNTKNDIFMAFLASNVHVFLSTLATQFLKGLCMNYMTFIDLMKLIKLFKVEVIKIEKTAGINCNKVIFW